MTRDPQRVPEEVLHRRAAADPQQVADSPIWGELAAARETAAAVTSLDALRSLRGTSRFRLIPPPDEPWPPKKAARPAARTPNPARSTGRLPNAVRPAARMLRRARRLLGRYRRGRR